MAYVAQIRTEEEAAQANWPCHWCAYGEILKEIEEICCNCRKQEYNTKPTEFKVAKTPR